ncbi:MAG TPA: CFI-box-CTERM domain-containing protein, partial [Nitratidesulfovibrio sp.]|nr:CFI-box-CTERM domain-containing protein [Nitratidesulfovibrio sp.]
TADIPSLSRYDFCFIATAAYGDLNHPVVAALREFRDKALMPHAPGRALVRAYYAVGPHLAGVVQDAPMLAAGMRAVLRPVAALAQLGLHAPVHLALSLLLCVALACLLGRGVRGRRSGRDGRDWCDGRTRQARQGRHARLIGHAPAAQAQRGAVLLSTIVTIVAFAVLAASAVTLMTSSTQSGYFATEGDKAYYLAESGFNAAASMFLHAGDSASDADLARKNLLADLSTRPYVLSGGAGSFELEARPYWFEVTSTTAAGSTTLQARVYGTRPPALTSSASGRLRIGNTSTTVYFNGLSFGTNTITFNGIRNGKGMTGSAQGLPTPVTQGTDVFLSSRVIDTVSLDTEGEDLSLGSGNVSALANFPQYNGMFTIRGGGNSGGVAYVYRERNGSTLRDVRLADGQNTTWRDINTSASTDADFTLEAFVELRSTGVSPGGTRRLVTYNVPIGWISGGAFNKERYIDTFDSSSLASSNWVTGGTERGELGGHSIAQKDGNNALVITSMQLATSTPGGNTLVDWLLAVLRAIRSWWSNSNYWSSIFFNWTQTNANMALAWVDAGYNLSYDAQVKMYLDQTDLSKLDHFGGMLVRGEQESITSEVKDLKAIGISFMRTYRVRTRTRGIIFWSSWSSYSLSTEIDQNLVPGYVSESNRGPLFAPFTVGSGRNAVTYDLQVNTVTTDIRDPIFGIKIGEQQTEKTYSHPVIMLWSREGGNFRWLAYKRLAASNLYEKNNTSPYSSYTLANWSTLLLRISEGRELLFSSAGGGTGDKDFNYGDFVDASTTSGSSGRARVMGPPIVTTGGWNAATGAWNTNTSGKLTLNNLEGTIANGATLRVDGSSHGTAASTVATSKSEYLRVYYGRATAAGANRIPTDETRNRNKRLDIGETPNWTTDDYAKWTLPQSAPNVDDNFTLVEWENVNSATGLSEIIVSTPATTNSVLKLDRFRTPDSSTTAPSEGIALVTAGTTGDRIAFDDFALQLDLRGGKGFLPPIQQ